MPFTILEPKRQHVLGRSSPKGLEKHATHNARGPRLWCCCRSLCPWAWPSRKLGIFAQDSTWRLKEPLVKRLGGKAQGTFDFRPKTGTLHNCYAQLPGPRPEAKTKTSPVRPGLFNPRWPQLEFSLGSTKLDRPSQIRCLSLQVLAAVVRDLAQRLSEASHQDNARSHRSVEMAFNTLQQAWLGAGTLSKNAI